MRPDDQQKAVTLHQVWSATNFWLDTLKRRVAENLDVMPALDFARWLQWSGLVSLLEANSCDGLAKVDGPLLRWKCEELMRDCQERFRTNDREPHLAELELQSIHEKLNLMAGYLSRLTVDQAGAAGPAAKLKVISGGLEETAHVDVEQQSGHLRG